MVFMKDGTSTPKCTKLLGSMYTMYTWLGKLKRKTLITVLLYTTLMTLVLTEDLQCMDELGQQQQKKPPVQYLAP